jgi:hypothetical protein
MSEYQRQIAPNPALNPDSPTAALRLLVGEPVNLALGRSIGW